MNGLKTGCLAIVIMIIETIDVDKGWLQSDWQLNVTYVLNAISECKTGCHVNVTQWIINETIDDDFIAAYYYIYNSHYIHQQKWQGALFINEYYFIDYYITLVRQSGLS